MAKHFAAHRPKPGAPSAHSAHSRAGNGSGGAPARPKSPAPAAEGKTANKPKEIGGPDGPEPTRYGDWEKKGVISDF